MTADVNGPTSQTGELRFFEDVEFSASAKLQTNKQKTDFIKYKATLVTHLQLKGDKIQKKPVSYILASDK